MHLWTVATLKAYVGMRNLYIKVALLAFVEYIHELFNFTTHKNYLDEEKKIGKSMFTT